MLSDWYDSAWRLGPISHLAFIVSHRSVWSVWREKVLGLREGILDTENGVDISEYFLICAHVRLGLESSGIAGGGV